MNKKGSIEATMLIGGGLLILLFVAVVVAIGIGITNWGIDIIAPEITGLGDVAGVNITQVGGYVTTPVDSFANSLNWLGGILYILGLLAIFGLAFAYRSTSQRWLIPMFFSLMILIIISSIFISQIYESFYTGTNEVALSLQAQPVLSWMILYSPAIITLVGFIAGAIMFSGAGSPEGGFG